MYPRREVQVKPVCFGNCVNLPSADGLISWVTWQSLRNHRERTNRRNGLLLLSHSLPSSRTCIYEYDKREHIRFNNRACKIMMHRDKRGRSVSHSTPFRFLNSYTHSHARNMSYTRILLCATHIALRYRNIVIIRKKSKETKLRIISLSWREKVGIRNAM